MSNLGSFVGLRERHLSVFPLQSRDKKPIGSWKYYQTEHATFEQCEEWDKACRYNIGIATGAVCATSRWAR